MIPRSAQPQSELTSLVISPNRELAQQFSATLPVTLVMMEAARDFHRRTGRIVGIKPAGGIRTAKEAIGYLVVLYETLGPRWMTPDLFRFGASSLLNDVLMQIRKERTGRYQGPDYFTVD